MPRQYPDVDSAGVSGFEFFVSLLVGALVRGVRPPELYALAERLEPDLLSAFPGMASLPPQARGAAVRMLTRELASQTPLPEHRFSPRRFPSPGRNEACDCGSGRKYKHCCQPFEQACPLEGMNLLPYVLDALPRKHWAQLPGSAIDPGAVAHTAATWLENGRAHHAELLLEPWFKADAPIPAVHEPLLDLLLDVYLELGRPRKRQRLLQLGLSRGDRTIRSAVHQRMATMAADRGDSATAWTHFRQAQREDADMPSLSHLEIILLLSEGKEGLARERARFWIARLRRLDATEHDELIAFLQKVATQGEAAFTQLPGNDEDPLAALSLLLSDAPPPAVRHVVAGSAREDGVLHPDPALARAIDAWTQAFPAHEPMLTSLDVDDHPAWDDPEPWLQCLRQRPELWQSFTVLDDLVLAVVPVYRVGLAPLRDALLGRAETLLRLHTDLHPGRQFPWGHLDNRPALRLLAQRIAAAGEPPDQAALARMDWMLVLNPDDNHGYRDTLAAALLGNGDPARALALLDRYADDSSLGLPRTLALYALGRQGDALRTLADAHAALPRLAPKLLAATPRKPRMRDGWITYGGADHAWVHRERWLQAWRRYDGALEWLRVALRD